MRKPVLPLLTFLSDLLNEIGRNEMVEHSFRPGIGRKGEKQRLVKPHSEHSGGLQKGSSLWRQRPKAERGASPRDVSHVLPNKPARQA
jgi:hypothetical protein